MSTEHLPAEILTRLGRQLEDFLRLWPKHMGNAGYLENTTARRSDTILSYEWFLESLGAVAESGDPPSFGELILNKDNWAAHFILTSRRHRARGVTGEMFIGCLKTLVHSVLEMVHDGDEPLQQKLQAVSFIRMWADALETIIIQDWANMSQREADSSLDHANRRLTLEKCKYENVLDSISELVLMINGRGEVLEANRSARRYFGTDPSGTSILDLLGIGEADGNTVYAEHTAEAPLEVSLGDDLYFHCVFVPLHEISLSSDGYLAVLKDITVHVKQSEMLETLVSERTSELVNKKNQLEEMNVTLRTVMKTVDKERESFEQNISRTVSRTLIPTLRTIRKETSGDIRGSYIDILEDQLYKLTQGGETGRQAMLLKLTPMEMKVCKFIQAGVTSQEIADALNLSIVTIQTHRRNIRRKLNIQNRKLNLHTYLNQNA
ncbi:MAG: PAS and helix-turn-helix domain-containing protein [Desulfobacterales bacterium]|nr:PAS and helix-turn-helix domain-containing protein [Desulfobacterales bacterium]